MMGLALALRAVSSGYDEAMVLRGVSLSIAPGTITALLIVEQNVGFALEAAGRYSVLNRGEIVAEGAAADGDAEHAIHAHLRV